MKIYTNPIGTIILTSVVLLAGLTGCGHSLVIENVNFAQPVESVVVPDTNNEIHDQRYAIRFSIDPLLAEEGIETVNEVRLIRNTAGYYFITADSFSNVYVLKADEGELVLEHKIELIGNNLVQPVFNQRGDFIELIDLSDGQSYQLSAEGVMNEDELRSETL